MKIIVIGASGRVGQELVNDLEKQGDEVVAASRHPQDNAGAKLQLDLHAEANEIAPQLDGFDAVYFTAGSRGKDNLGTDLDGAIKTMQAAEMAGVKRYIMLSAAFALDRSKWNNPGIAAIKDYYIAKHYADLYLVHESGLDYTILQPGTLQELPATGTTSFTPEAGSNTIPDVAAVLAELAHADNTIGKVITMHAGQTPIAEAVKAI
ncbi:SDR family oxidoreductase [Lacticaseibacillus zhaodongensis]|uniref:SDR family oxidoreductase n=1 Tax=Lacticaseibacillus zhaodongensis TaxID=2668065 RepID=UPI0012D35FCB|nr:SDR family oxidoreductase [Lacticaseibacillus zhaodongensis]